MEQRPPQLPAPRMQPHRACSRTGHEIGSTAAQRYAAHVTCLKSRRSYCFSRSSLSTRLSRSSSKKSKLSRPILRFCRARNDSRVDVGGGGGGGQRGRRGRDGQRSRQRGLAEARAARAGARAGNRQVAGAEGRRAEVVGAAGSTHPASAGALALERQEAASQTHGAGDDHQRREHLVRHSGRELRRGDGRGRGGECGGGGGGWRSAQLERSAAARVRHEKEPSVSEAAAAPRPRASPSVHTMLSFVAAPAPPPTVPSELAAHASPYLRSRSPSVRPRADLLGFFTLASHQTRFEFML